jgi:hypothetical protein
MDPTLAVTLFGIGGAAIGFWAVVRYPGLGPQTVTKALLVTVAVTILQTPLLSLMPPMVAAVGAGGALLVVATPSLALLFWACGCLVRSLVLLAAPYRR